MSTEYKTFPAIPVSMLFDGRLERFNVREISSERVSASAWDELTGCPIDREEKLRERRSKMTDDHYYEWARLDELSLRVLSDGIGSVQVEPSALGNVRRLYPGSNSNNILNAIVDACDCEIVTDDDPQFFGYDTWEECYATGETPQEQEAKYRNRANKRKHYKKFFAELRKFLEGSPCRLKPGTHGMAMAERARLQIKRTPELIKPENEAALLDLIFFDDEGVRNRDYFWALARPARARARRA